VLVFSAGLLAMQGDFDEARERARRAATRFAELGWTTRASTDVAPVLAQIEQLAGDFAAAERILQESCTTLERGSDRAHDLSHLSTQAAQLADLLCERGDLDQAERWLAVAQRCAARIDADAQLWWRVAGAGIAAGRDDVDRAELYAREAVDLSEKTDALNNRGAAALGLAQALFGRPEAAHWIERAVSLYEQKENIVAAMRARTLLHELSVA
jgi:tetratricopeptide (TPR) repeat protein